MAREVLLVGESWSSTAMHAKGWDIFHSTTFHTGADAFLRAIEEGGGLRVTWMKVHEAAEGFPFEAAGLDRYDAVILSDLGANTLLLPADVWLRGLPRPNRLRLLADWVARGGGLMMVGGYLSYQGIDGRARWRRTPVEDALPVTMLPHDDRLELPEGFVPRVRAPGHPILAGLGPDWPLLLGANEVIARPGAEVLLSLPEDQGGHPLLVAGRHGRGRTLAWTSDIGPHWLPEAFSSWAGFGRLFRQALAWLCEGRSAAP
jgi:uncharacterized membrane protein